jgi:hypothetical protein
MRLVHDRQGRFEFQRSTLKITNEFYDRYAAISEILDDVPKVLQLLDADVAGAIRKQGRRARVAGRPCDYTSENVLRILVCQVVEGLSLREVVVRIDDSCALRQFVRIHDDPMMDYTTLCKLKNAVKPETWKRINHALASSRSPRTASTAKGCAWTPRWWKPTSDGRRTPVCCGMSLGCSRDSSARHES